jgi:hypothetical protein
MVWMHGSARGGYPSDSSQRLTAAGVARFFSNATAQGLRLRRRRRLSPPAPCAGRISGRSGAAWSALMRPADTRRPGPSRDCPVPTPGRARPRIGGSLCVRRHAAGRSLRASHRAGARCAPIAGEPTLPPAGLGGARLRDWRPGRGLVAPRSPERSHHLTTAIGPWQSLGRGSRDH